MKRKVPKDTGVHNVSVTGLGLESKASSTDGVLQLAFKNILRWKNSQVLRNVYPGCVKLQELDLTGAGTGAKDDSKWLVFSFFTLVFGQPTKVEFHLPLVLWPEASLSRCTQIPESRLFVFNPFPGVGFPLPVESIC